MGNRMEISKESPRLTKSGKQIIIIVIVRDVCVFIGHGNSYSHALLAFMSVGKRNNIYSYIIPI